VGGINLGKLPIEGIFPPGQHQIVVRAAGAPDQTRVADIAAGQRVAMEFDFKVASRSAAAMTQKRGQSEDGSAANEPAKQVHQRQASTYRTKEEYERAKDAAYDRFDAQWEARKNALKREEDYCDNQIDHSDGAAEERWKRRKEDVERRLDQLDDQKDAAKEILKRQWND
jgi:hypothetical protein